MEDEMRKFLSKNAGLFYIAPWILGFLVFRGIPFLASLVLSFTNFRPLKKVKFIGFDNYIQCFGDADFLNSMFVTFKYVACTVPLKLTFALFIAYILNFKLKMVNVFRTAYYIPSILGGSVAIALLWRFIFREDGLVNLCLAFFGLPGINWLGDPGVAVVTISLLRVWQFGSAMVIFLAALKNIPEDLYEAARIDGASKVKQFFSITLPLLTPVIFFNFVMQLVQAFQEFNSAYLITQGGPQKATYLMPLLIYNTGIFFHRMGLASAMAWIMFVIIMVFTIIAFKTQKKWVYYADE